MSMNPIAYATDEDIALRASADFTLLCPRDQRLASGSDGLFDPTDRWTLRSASVDFGAQGLAPGQVVLLTGPTSTFRSPGEALVIQSVAPGAVTLRRKGQPAGVGQPPGPLAGLMNVEFLAATLGPQIAAASNDLNRRYGIDDLVADRRTSDLYDPKEVRDVVVLSVLYRQYIDVSREAGGQEDVFAAKARLVKADLDELLGRVVVHWSSALEPGVPQPSTSRFGTRLSR